MGFVAIRNATTNAWRAAQRKKAVVPMGFAGRSDTTPIPTMIAPSVHVTGKTSARTTMAFLARQRRNVCPTIASMACVAATFAWVHVRRVRPRKKVAASMASAATLQSIPIPTMSAIRANVPGQAHVMQARSPRAPMAPRAHRLRNVNLGFARMASAAKAGAWAVVKRARRPRKTRVWMACAGPLPTTKTPTTNVGAAHAMARASANNTMAYRARTRRNVCRTIASMECVAVTFARACVTRVRNQRKDKASTAYVLPLHPVAMSRMNAIRVNVMDREHVFCPKRHKPMARHAFPAGNAHRAIASTGIVATRRVTVLV